MDEKFNINRELSDYCEYKYEFGNDVVTNKATGESTVVFGYAEINEPSLSTIVANDQLYTGNWLLPKLYFHYQTRGRDEFYLDASTLDFSHTSQKELNINQMKIGDIRAVNLFSSEKNINQNSLAFGVVEMEYMGNNRFSITKNRFDFDYQENASFNRNAGTFVGGLVFGQIYETPITPFAIDRDYNKTGGAFDVIFFNTVYIPIK